MRGRRNGGRPRAGIQEVGSGTIRVRKAHSTQYIMLTEQIAGLLSAFAQQPEYEDFTRIKTTLQSLNELVSGMGFTSRERRAFRQTVQQVATIPNTNNLPHIWTRIDAALALIRSYGERIGVGEAIIQALTGLQDDAPGEGTPGADSEEPENLKNPSRLDRTAADKEAEQGTRMRLSAVVQEMNEQPGRSDDDTSQQLAQPRQSTDEKCTLQQPNETETLPERVDQQLMSGAHAYAGEIVEHDKQAYAPETASHALLPAARTSSEAAQEGAVQQRPESLRLRREKGSDAADARDRTDTLGNTEPNAAEGEAIPISPAEATDRSGEGGAGSAKTVSPAPQGPGSASGGAVNRPVAITGSAGLNKPAGASETIEAAESARATSSRGPHGPKNKTDQADPARIETAGPAGSGVSDPVVGGTVLYTGDGGSQHVMPHSPVAFTASTLQGVSFNGTDSLTITSAGFYYLEWRISLLPGQATPSSFGIVMDGNMSGTAGLHSNSGKALVSGSAVLNCSVGNTLALYNRSEAAVTVKASQLSISKIRN